MKPNILFLIIDSLRADKCFGDTKTSLTPNIDSLINNGIYFSQAISSVASSAAALGTIFTGLFPFKTGMGDKSYKKLNSKIPNFIEHLKNNGYNTHASTSEINSLLGLTADFDLQMKQKHHKNYFSLFSGFGEKIIQKLKSDMKEPWFFYLHLNDLHQPILVPKDFDAKKFGSNQYEKMISAIDYWIGNFLQKIDINKTLVVLTADHGDYIRSLESEQNNINLEAGIIEKSLWQIGNKVPSSLYSQKKKISSILHKIRVKQRATKTKNLNLNPYQKRVLTGSRMVPGNDTFDDVIRVPLLFSGYGIKSKQIISQQVRHVDIFPTIIELLGLPKINNSIDGVSLLEFFKGGKLEEEPTYIESMPHIENNQEKIIGIRTSQYKYLRNKSDSTKEIELYDLKNDPLEEKNIADGFPEIVKTMENNLNQIRNKKSEVTSTISDEETKKIEAELRKLGYL